MSDHKSLQEAYGKVYVFNESKANPDEAQDAMLLKAVTKLISSWTMKDSVNKKIDELLGVLAEHPGIIKSIREKM